MNNNFNNFNNMDDIFNQLMGNMGGYSTQRRRYSINGRESDTGGICYVPSDWLPATDRRSGTSTI